MDIKEKNAIVEKFNEHARNEEYEDAFNLIYNDIDFNVFSMSARKRFIKHISSMDGFDNKKLGYIIKKLEKISTMIESQGATPSSNALDIILYYPELFKDSNEFVDVDKEDTIISAIKDLDSSMSERAINKFVSFATSFCAENIRSKQALRVGYSLMSHVWRNHFSINKENSAKLADVVKEGKTEIGCYLSAENILSLHEDSICDISRDFLNSKVSFLKKFVEEMFKASCQNEKLNIVESILKSGFKSITYGIESAMERQTVGLIPLILKYNPRKPSPTMFNMFMRHRARYVRSYVAEISQVGNLQYAGYAAMKNIVDRIRGHAFMIRDVQLAIDYALKKGPLDSYSYDKDLFDETNKECKDALLQVNDMKDGVIKIPVMDSNGAIDFVNIFDCDKK